MATWRALANRPKLLLADEPTGEVDSATAQALLELFRELNQAYGLTTIVVNHDPQMVAYLFRWKLCEGRHKHGILGRPA